MADTNGSTVRRRNKAPEGSTTANQAHKTQSPQTTTEPPFQLRSKIVYYILFISHTIAALYHPIQDCDEVFNYWEPTHYLTNGHGFQTWEYSPVYAIRSWAYIGIHALVTLVPRAITLGFASKAIEFYFLRIVLGFICTLCEARLFSKIASVLNPRVAITFLIIMATAPGMFHASISYLPSSFAMYTTMLGMAAFMDWRGGLRTAQGIFAIGSGAVLGWPFAAAMALPFLLEELALASISDKQGMVSLAERVLYGSVRTLLVLAVQVGIDAFFYKKLIIVPWNIVWYNVFSRRGGPDLYGTEPWHFYLRNLFLNFHLWLVLALLSLPLLILQHFFRAKGATRTSYLRGVVFLSPFYLWLAIFTLQPHKEERFMYPAYPALALNAAWALHIILASFASTDPKDIISKIPVKLRFTATLGFMLSCLALSIYRVRGTTTAYHAPLSSYQPLHKANVTRPGDTVCLGKEWYRFPSHYLLPRDVKAKFIKSEFSGLLPGEFHEGASGEGFGLFPGTWLEPPGMNDQNREDTGKYTNIKHCNFLVDLNLPTTETTKLEPNYIADTEHWDKIICLPFLDATATGLAGRMGWVPDLSVVPEKYRRRYGEYCLLRRKKKQEAGQRINPVPHIETLG